VREIGGCHWAAMTSTSVPESPRTESSASTRLCIYASHSEHILIYADHTCRSPQSLQPKINDVVTNNDISRHDEAITIAGTTSFKLYVIVIVNSVVTNDDAINISEVTENMNMTISVTTAAILKRSQINSPAQSDPTGINTCSTHSHLCSSLEDIYKDCDAFSGHHHCPQADRRDKWRAQPRLHHRFEQVELPQSSPT
jgi:hypothetical protein